MGSWNMAALKFMVLYCLILTASVLGAAESRGNVGYSQVGHRKLSALSLERWMMPSRASEKKATAEDTPAADEASPAADEATPAADEATPAADEASPAAEEASPAAEEATPDAAAIATPAVPQRNGTAVPQRLDSAVPQRIETAEPQRIETAVPQEGEAAPQAATLTVAVHKFADTELGSKLRTYEIQGCENNGASAERALATCVEGAVEEISKNQTKLKHKKLNNGFFPKKCLPAKGRVDNCKTFEAIKKDLMLLSVPEGWDGKLKALGPICANLLSSERENCFRKKNVLAMADEDLNGVPMPENIKKRIEMDGIPKTEMKAKAKEDDSDSKKKKKTKKE